MKKIILIILTTALFVTEAFSQAVLTSAINPVPGNVDAYIICDTTNITEGNSGAGQTWNFTSLTRQDSTSIVFVAANTTPYASQFPSSNIASTNDDSNYSYMTSSQSNLLVNGNGGPKLIIPYSDPQLYMQYPFAFGNSFNDNFSANYTAFGSPTVRTGHTTVTADAWGTINLPDNPYPGALRVKYVTMTKDSSNPGVPFVIVTNLTAYVWFAPGKKFPVFEVVYSSITLNGTLFGSTKVINYNRNSTPIGIKNISSAVPERYLLSQNYPNPFNPVTNLEFGISELGFVSLKVYDIIGKEVATLVNTNLNAGTYKYDFDASRLTSGIYYYTLKVNEFVETKKMILLK